MNAEHILQIIALLGINSLAFIYDAEYINLAIGIDALILGINIRNGIRKSLSPHSCGMGDSKN